MEDFLPAAGRAGFRAGLADRVLPPEPLLLDLAGAGLLTTLASEATLVGTSCSADAVLSLLLLSEGF